MKTLSLIFLLFFVISCKKEYRRKVTRTVDTPSSLNFKEKIPLYRNDCTIINDFGSRFDCRDRFYNSFPNDCYYDRSGRRYCGSYYGGHYRSRMRYSSCNRQRQICKRVFIKNFEASITLNFDKNAKLIGSQKEDYIFDGNYKEGQFVGKVIIKSKHYKYKEPKKLYIQDGDKVSINFHIQK